MLYPTYRMDHKLFRFDEQLAELITNGYYEQDPRTQPLGLS